MPHPTRRTTPLPPRGGIGSVIRFWYWLSSSLRERGIRSTIADAASTFEHYWFDVRHRTSTRTSVKLDDLSINSANKASGVGYQPSPPILFHRLMAHVDLPRDSVFVDLGCGKGRTLLMASRYPFARIVGVEFSPDLCALARRNVEIFRRRNRTRAIFEIVESDVATYEIEDDQNVFYLFNPFDGTVLSALLDHIGASRRRRPRPVWLLYAFPTRRRVIEDSGNFAAVEVVRYGAGEGVLYRSIP